MTRLRLWVLEKVWSYWARRYTRKLREANVAKGKMLDLEPDIELARSATKV